MVDEVVTPEIAPTAAPAVVEAAPVVTETAPEPAIVETAPVTETVTPEVKTEAAPETPKVETLLGGDKKIEEAKTEDKPAEVKTEEPAKVELPAYEPFVLPEGVTFEPEKMGEFTKTLAEFETTTNASREEVQKFGQQLIDRHVSEVKDTLDRYTKSLTEAWNKQKTDWKDSFLKDPEFANRTDTVVNSAIDAIGVYGGNTKQQEEFRNLMETSGVGNHPAMIRLLSNIMQAKAEPRQLAAPQVAAPEKLSKVAKMYGKR